MNRRTGGFRNETSKITTLPGGHHYNDDYAAIVN
nr:virulence factor [Pedobacter schmidteae]